MQRAAKIGFRGLSGRVAIAIAIFGLTNAVCIYCIAWIRQSDIGWSLTGFHGIHAEFRLGYDLLWFPVFLLLTEGVFAIAARTLDALTARQLVAALLPFTLIRVLLAYTYWLNLAVVAPVIQRLSPPLGRWPPGGMPGEITVAFVEVLFLSICVVAVVLVQDRRESANGQVSG